MTYADKMVRHYAKEAMLKRLAEIGKTELDLYPDDVEEILALVVKDSRLWVIDYETYMHRVIRKHSDGGIFLNL